MTDRVAAVRMTLAALVVLLASSACASGDAVAPSPSPSLTAELSLPGEGTLWLGAGPSQGAMNLYRVSADGGPVEQLTDLRGGLGISEIAAGSGRVMVAAAPAGHDQIYEVVDGQLELFIEGRVFTPMLSDDGHLAYQRMLDPANPGESPEALVVHDLATGQETAVHEALQMGGPVWGPEGTVAVLEKEIPAYTGRRLVLIDRQGNKREVDIGGPAVTAPRYWGPGRQLVLMLAESRGDRRYWLFDPATGQRTPLPSGWRVLRWSPDGEQLLVAQGERLGLLRPGAESEVVEVGRFPMPVWNAVWIAPQTSGEASGRVTNGDVNR